MLLSAVSFSHERLSAMADTSLDPEGVAGKFVGPLVRHTKPLSLGLRLELPPTHHPHHHFMVSSDSLSERS